VIDIFHKLLVNDGQDIHPLYMNLSTRPNFAKRFNLCFSGVADGKGLSDVIVYSGEGGSQEDIPGDTTGVEDGELVNGEAENDEIFNDAENQDFGDELSTQLLETEDVADTNNTNKNLEAVEKLHELTSAAAASEEILQNHAALDNPAPNDSLGSNDGEHNDHNTPDKEDDLIDYSDEELEVPDGQQATKAYGKSNYINSSIQNGNLVSVPLSCHNPRPCYCANPSVSQ
jgi:hypothetical protein